MDDYRILWGDTHDNTYTHGRQDPPMDEVLGYAASHLDFYAGAYYTAINSAAKPGGHQFEATGKVRLGTEDWKDAETLVRDWAEFQEATRAAYRPGQFVTFPGYEWQGDGTWGDHNVSFKEEGGPLLRVDTLPELYAGLRGLDAIAIPHHIGYVTRHRAPRWEEWDEELSPYAEIYSVHGCSETDEEWTPLRRNVHMGPGAGPSAYEFALARGLHLGCICSTDNWGRMPGRYNHGVMACLATDATRDAVWEAMIARRVYGSTGDRIALDFTVNDAPMGSVIDASSGVRRIRARVVGVDEIDRIELIRGGRVVATHCHQGTWTMPAPGQTSRYKMRVEIGWGPRPNEIEMPDEAWNGNLSLGDGRFTGWHPCWISPGHGRPVLDGPSAAFQMRTSNKDVMSQWQNANVFEFETTPETSMRLELNSQTEEGKVGEFAEASRLMWYRDASLTAIERATGLKEADLPRPDLAYHMAYKCKIHRPIPEAAYTATLEIDDDEPIDGETFYRVRVEQRNGQRAWSSPIWVR